MTTTLSPAIAIHLSAAVVATLIGPLALWARQGRRTHPRLHRAFGYAWVTLMVVAATSALFISGDRLPHIAGIGPIHLLIPVTFSMLILAFWFLAKGDITGHRKTMQRLYVGACLVAGAFTLLPGRFLNNLVFGQWLGLISPISPISQAPQGTPMIAKILFNTPLWVWGLLAALLALGFSQTRSRRAGLARITLLPLGLGAFSLYGTVSAFGASPTVIGSWLAATTLLILIVTQMPLPAGARYDSASRQFQVPGSWMPMALIMGIFLTKYVVGVSLVMHPELKANANFSLAVGTLYGVYSGIFAGRAVRLLRLLRLSRPSRLAMRRDAAPTLPVLNA
jgi:uncharacterized membrane protein